jgi:two-component system, chemotaxis family, protein-glutamate methylesterase/glutaminase
MNGEEHSSRLVRVLVADDSAFMRTALTRMIESDPALRVSGAAQTGLEVLEKIASLQPDVVTLDVEMPGLNGLETLRRIMQTCPRPVIMVSSLTKEGAETTLEALALGAFDYVPKQSSLVSLDITDIRKDLVAKIKAAAETLSLGPAARIPPAAIKAAATTAHHPLQVLPRIVALGTSTGGPKALQEILPALPADLPVAVLVVQHMPPGFTGPFARRLDNLCQVSVREAQDNESISSGVVYLAPAGRHMTVYRKMATEVAIRISDTPHNTLHTPSADVMMSSVAEVFRAASMGVIMTGMGSDGLEGMRAIARVGGTTVGQDEASCVVYGMPRACAESGILQRVVSLSHIPQQILQATQYRRRA